MIGTISGGAISAAYTYAKTGSAAAAGYAALEGAAIGFGAGLGLGLGAGVFAAGAAAAGAGASVGFAAFGITSGLPLLGLSIAKVVDAEENGDDVDKAFAWANLVLAIGTLGLSSYAGAGPILAEAASEAGVNVNSYSMVNIGSGGENPTGANVLHINIADSDLPSDVQGGRLIADATNLKGIPSNHFDLAQANHMPGDEALIRGLVSEAYRVLKPGGVGVFSSSSYSGVKTVMEEAGFKSVRITGTAARTMYGGRITNPAIQYEGIK